MTSQATRIYSGGDGASADLLWDDATLTTSGVRVHVPDDGRQRVVNAVIGGQPISLTYDPGTDTTFSFPDPLALTIVQTRKGTPGMVIAGFEAFGVATED